MKIERDLVDAADIDGAENLVAGQIAEKDAPAAVEIANLLPDGHERTGAMMQIAWRWARSDSTSVMSFTMYTALATSENATNALNASSTAV